MDKKYLSIFFYKVFATAVKFPGMLLSKTDGTKKNAMSRRVEKIA